MKITKYLLLICIVIVTGNATFAQEISEDSLYSLSLEDLMNIEVVTASKVAEKASDAPGIISTISSREIEQFGAISLTEVLERVTGVLNMSSDLAPQNTVTFRGDLSGESNNHTLILINGRPNRESLYGGLDYSLLLAIPLSAVDRIEIIRGPGSVLYGSNAFSGVVNIILKKGGDQVNKISTYTGSFGGVGVDGFVGIDKGDFNVSVGYKKFRETGWEFIATDRNGVRDTASYGENNTGLTMQLGYKGLSINSVVTESTQITVGPDWDNQSDKISSSTRFLTDIGYEVKYSDKVSTKLNATLNRSDLNVLDFVKGSNNDILIEVANFYRSSDKLNILLGGTYYKQTGYITDFLPKFDKTWYNGYLQADYRVISPLKIIAGLQVNKIESVDVNIVPRFGAIYNITEKFGTKVLYGHAFRAAYGIETDFQAGGVLGDKNLKPETLKNLDVQFFYAARKVELAATYFNNKKVDNIILNEGTFTNGGTNKSSGFEIEGKFVPSTNFYINGSYAYQTNELDAIDGSIRKEASLMPNHIAKIGVGYQSNSGISVGLFDMYVSKFHTYDGQEDLPNVNGDINGYNNLSANISINISRIFKTSMKDEMIFSIYGINLLDADISLPDYASRAVYSLPVKPGRALYAMLCVQF